jgi:hypothetical protein
MEEGVIAVDAVCEVLLIREGSPTALPAVCRPFSMLLPSRSIGFTEQRGCDPDDGLGGSASSNAEPESPFSHNRKNWHRHTS